MCEKKWVCGSVWEMWKKWRLWKGLGDVKRIEGCEEKRGLKETGRCDV